jgi:hypothetical protein
MNSLKNLEKDIKQGKASVQEYRELLANVLIRNQCLRTSVKVRKVKFKAKSHAVLGIQNIEEVEREVTVKIDNVLVDGGSSVIVDFQNKVDLKDFWAKSAYYTLSRPIGQPG